jgi:hypothetical protein
VRSCLGSADTKIASGRVHQENACFSQSRVLQLFTNTTQKNFHINNTSSWCRWISRSAVISIVTERSLVRFRQRRLDHFFLSFFVRFLSLSYGPIDRCSMQFNFQPLPNHRPQNRLDAGIILLYNCMPNCLGMTHVITGNASDGFDAFGLPSKVMIATGFHTRQVQAPQ